MPQLSKKTKATVTFTKEKDTKNAHRYAEDVADDETALVGTLYLRKSEVEGEPQQVSVTIEVTA